MLFRSFSPGSGKSPPELYPDIALQQMDDTITHAHEEMSIDDARKFLRTRGGYSFPSVCECCGEAFDAVDPDFILCTTCEDKFHQ